MNDWQTNSVTFSSLDAKRADKQAYHMLYEPLDAEGEVVATSAAQVDWT